VTTAQRHADRSARRPKLAKLALIAALRTYVEERLQASPLLRGELLFPARLRAEETAGMDRGSIDAGQTPGARSKLLAACWSSTSQTMRDETRSISCGIPIAATAHAGFLQKVLHLAKSLPASLCATLCRGNAP
jgi:hypothetical protein